MPDMTAKILMVDMKKNSEISRKCKSITIINLILLESETLKGPNRNAIIQLLVLMV